MCKLCRLDHRLPMKFMNTKKETYNINKQIYEISLCYFNENICSFCLVNIKKYSTKYNISIDQTIIRTLFISFATKKQRELLRDRQRRKLAGAKRKRKVAEPRIKEKSTLIETNIHKITQTRTNNSCHSYFKLSLAVNKNKIFKTFKTLEEARQFKQEVLNGYHNQYNTVAA